MDGTHEPARPGQGTSFGDLFVEALGRSGLTLTQLQERLEVRGHQISLATLSYWRSGQRSPSRRSVEVVTELELLLGLAPGALRDVASARAPAMGPRPRPVQWSRAPGVAEAVRSARAALGLGQGAEELRPLSLATGMDVGADGRPELVRSRTLSQAPRSGIRRTAVVLDLEEPVAERPPLVELFGAVEGEVVSFPELGLFVTELVLPRPLQQGETVPLSQTYAWPATVRPWREHWVEATRTHADLTLWVRFHPDAVPTSWEVFTETAEEDRTRPLDPRGRTSAHLNLTGFGPGRAGIRWSS